MLPQKQFDLIRPALTLVILGLLVAFSLWVIKPFAPALVWAAMIVVATWPLMTRLEARVGRKRWIAVVVMTLTLLLVFVVPFSLAIGTLVSHVDDITGWIKSIDVHNLETPPAWVVKTPMVGERLDAAWRDIGARADVSGKIAPYLGSLASWALAQLGSLGSLVVQFLLMVGIAALLYAKGEVAAGGVLAFARRIGGQRGEGAVVLAGQAIRGVALGVVVTAIAQSVLGGIGLVIAGVPYAAVLTALMFMLAVAQIGAGPVMIGATIWAFARGETGWGVMLIVWTVVVSGMDNVLRPILIKRGADLPLILILVGVIGGMISFGLVGIFIGPIVLAVTYKLLDAWIAEPEPDSTPAAAGEKKA